MSDKSLSHLVTFTGGNITNIKIYDISIEHTIDENILIFNK
jgi:hypothetical protein